MEEMRVIGQLSGGRRPRRELYCSVGGGLGLSGVIVLPVLCGVKMKHSRVMYWLGVNVLIAVLYNVVYGGGKIRPSAAAGRVVVGLKVSYGCI